MQEQSKNQSLRDRVSTCKSNCLCACACTWMSVCIMAYCNKRAQEWRADLIVDRLNQKMNGWMNEWMLKAKMVQKACGERRLDKPRWEEWWTVAQHLSLFSNMIYPTYLFKSSFFFAYKQKKESKVSINQKVVSSTATGDIWLMSQRT